LKRLIFPIFLLAFIWITAAQAQESQWPAAVLDPGRAQLVLVVDKARQELRIYSYDGQGQLFLEKVIPCSTGMIQGDKLVRGDKKTPEGYYIFRQKLLPEELPDIYGILAYPMDYPNFWDKNVGRGGDGIWTHGVNKPLVDYDSNGCIELLNHDLAGLEDYIRLNDTPILVADELTMAPAAEQKILAAEVRDFIESWRKAWSEKNLPAYRLHYDPLFVNTENRTFNGWMEQKRHISSIYNKIDVQLEDIRIFWHRDVIMVSFIQNYKGDNRFNSKGLKRLYLKKANPGLLIVGEEFTNLPGPAPSKKLTDSQKTAALTTPPLAVASVSDPVAVASAGTLTPNIPVRPAQGPISSAEAANEESSRTALERGAEARTRQDTGQAAAGGAAAPPSSPQVPAQPVPSQPAAAPGPETTLVAQNIPTPVSTAPAAPAVPADNYVPVVESHLPPPPILSDLNPVLAGPPSVPDAAPSPAAADLTPPAPGSQSAPEVQPGSSAGPQAGSQAGSQAGPTSPINSEPSEEQLKIVVAGWLAAWNARDEEGYFNFYGADFYFPEKKIHLASFKKYRGRMISSAKHLKVDAENLKINVQGQSAKAVFIQNYESDRTKDRGEKTLSFSLQNGQWQIVGEDWQARP
jgi:murein L,D-transpeptidase YafK